MISFPLRRLAAASARPTRPPRPSPRAGRRSAAAALPLAALLLLGACSDGETDEADGAGGVPPVVGADDVPAPDGVGGDAGEERDEADTAAPGGAGTLSRGGVERPLSGGLLIDYGPTGAHYNVDIGLADASYRVSSLLQPDFVFGGLTTIVTYPADDSTVEFDAALYSPGTDGFRDGTFEFVDIEESALEDAPAALLGRAVFVNAFLYPDADGDGESDVDGIAVGGGRLAIRTTATGFAISLDVTLVDGTRLTGSYAGSALILDQTD